MLWIESPTYVLTHVRTYDTFVVRRFALRCDCRRISLIGTSCVQFVTAT